MALTPRSSIGALRANRLKELEEENKLLQIKLDKIELMCSKLIEENKLLKHEQCSIENNYSTDEEELARETNWILQKRQKTSTDGIHSFHENPSTSKNFKSNIQNFSSANKNPKAAKSSGQINNSNGDKTEDMVHYSTDEDDLENETGWIIQKHKRKKIPSTNLQISDSTIKNTKQQNKQNSNTREQLPPPVIVNGIASYNDMLRFLNKSCKEQALVKLINKDSFKISTKNSDDYRALTKTLNDDKIPWYSYENKLDRPIKVIVKNLHHSCTSEEIVADLKRQGLKALSAINKLKWKSKEPLDMFMLSFESTENIENIYKTKAIMGSIVKIEPIKQSRLIPQCINCQSFGHTKNFCGKQPRCVKCAGKHQTKDCQKSPSQQPKCRNCSESHPASYRGCIVAKELQKIRNKSKRNKERILKPPLRYIDKTPKRVDAFNARATDQKNFKLYSTVAKSSSQVTSSNDNMLAEIFKMLKEQQQVQSNIALRLGHIEKIINP